MSEEKWKVTSFLFAILLIISLIFILRAEKLASTGYVVAGLGKNESKYEIVYLYPEACGEPCSPDKYKEWIEGTNISLRSFKGDWLRGPVALLLHNGKVSIIELMSKRQMLGSICSATDDKKICKLYEESINKTDVVGLDLYIMSFCPFGMQMVEVLEPVYELLKNDIKFNLHFVIYPSEWYSNNPGGFCIDGYCSMHGVFELKEDIRQKCIFSQYPERWWDYALCMISKYRKNPWHNDTLSPWQDCAKQAGISVDDVLECMQNEGIRLIAEDYELNKKYGVTGSPTLFINGEMYAGERTPEALKEEICKYFKTKPEECEEKLSSESSAAQGRC